MFIILRLQSLSPDEITTSVSNCKYVSVAVKVSGDGSCDTPGHSAKFCCHSLVQLVQSNEVANSNCMEGEGLKRGVEQLSREHSPTEAQKLRSVERVQDRRKNQTPSRRKPDSKRRRVRRKQEVGKSGWTDELNRISQSACRIFLSLPMLNRMELDQGVPEDLGLFMFVCFSQKTPEVKVQRMTEEIIQKTDKPISMLKIVKLYMQLVTAVLLQNYGQNRRF